MVMKIDGAGRLAGSAGSSRLASAAIPFEGSIAPASSGRNSSPAEPLQAQVQTPGGGTQPYAQARQAAIAPAPAPAQQYAPEPAPMPSGPRAGGREAYNQLDAGGQAATDSQWLAGDSDYTAQVAEYDKALQSFVDRIAKQRGEFTKDAELATASTNRNQEMSLNNLGEDFGARGLSYSGMFDTTKNDTNQRFNEAKGGIERIRAKNDTDAVNRETDYKSENAISKSNASRASLGRQAQRQALIDSGAF